MRKHFHKLVIMHLFVSFHITDYQISKKRILCQDSINYTDLLYVKVRCTTRIKINICSLKRILCGKYTYENVCSKYTFIIYILNLLRWNIYSCLLFDGLLKGLKIYKQFYILFCKNDKCAIIKIINLSIEHNCACVTAASFQYIFVFFYTVVNEVFPTHGPK